MFAVWMSDKFPTVSNKNDLNIFSGSGFNGKKSPSKKRISELEVCVSLVVRVYSN